jgi:rubredoxin
MQGWRCDRCGYTHIFEEATKTPTRCPSCRSTRLSEIPSKLGAQTLSNLSVPEIYAMLNRITISSVQQQAIARRCLQESGVYILCFDENNGPLREILSKKEIDEYRSLVRDRNFGLAVIGRTVVAISPNSPIRIHVGINREKFTELE